MYRRYIKRHYLYLYQVIQDQGETKSTCWDQGQGRASQCTHMADVYLLCSTCSSVRHQSGVWSVGSVVEWRTTCCRAHGRLITEVPIYPDRVRHEVGEVQRRGSGRDALKPPAEHITSITHHTPRITHQPTYFPLTVMVYTMGGSSLSGWPSSKIWKFKWNNRELVTRMYRIDVRASHYKINPPLLVTTSGYKHWHYNCIKHSLAPFSARR